MTPGKTETLLSPYLTWRVARADVDAWFLARGKAAHTATLRVIMAPGDHSLAVCPAGGQGYMLSGGSARLTVGSVTPPDDDRAMVFGAGRSPDDERLVCRMVAQAGGGG